MGFVLLVALAIGGLWFASAQSSRLGPEAEPLQTLDAAGLREALDGLRREQKLVGLAARIVVDGEIIADAASGWRTKAEETALSANDLFHVGSIGKSMSATVLARLVEAGRMGWTDTIGQRLSAIPHDPAWADVTLEQLLTHRGSIPRAPLSGMVNQVSEPTRLAEIRREMAAAVLADPPATPPGTAFAYSNEGYMLAALMAEEATGQSWEALIANQLVTPLALSSLGFGAPTGAAPWGHRKLGPFKIGMNPNEGSADNPPWMAAAGTMHMSLDDLLSYGQAHLDAGMRDTAILSTETFATLHTPILNDYAYGWVVQTRDLETGSIPVLWHNGSNTMWYALLVLMPDHNAMIAIATNDGSHLNRTQRRFDDLVDQIMTALTAPVSALQD